MVADPRFPGVSIHESAYVDDPCRIGEQTRIWHFSHVLGGCDIGKQCSIGQNVMIGPNVTVGDNCKIQNNVSLFEGVELEDGVFCGPSCVFTNVFNPRAEVERKSEFRKTLAKRGATIGANATIVCGYTLGAYCFVAAGAVVASDVPDFALMAGGAGPPHRMDEPGGRPSRSRQCVPDRRAYLSAGRRPPDPGPSGHRVMTVPHQAMARTGERTREPCAD